MGLTKRDRIFLPLYVLIRHQHARCPQAFLHPSLLFFSIRYPSPQPWNKQFSWFCNIHWPFYVIRISSHRYECFSLEQKPCLGPAARLFYYVTVLSRAFYSRAVLVRRL